MPGRKRLLPKPEGLAALFKEAVGSRTTSDAIKHIATLTTARVKTVRIALNRIALTNPAFRELMEQKRVYNEGRGGSRKPIPLREIKRQIRAVLIVLRKNPGVSQRELAEEIGLDEHRLEKILQRIGGLKYLRAKYTFSKEILLRLYKLIEERPGASERWLGRKTGITPHVLREYLNILDAANVLRAKMRKKGGAEIDILHILNNYREYRNQIGGIMNGGG